jgi:hypothetical protein
VSKTVNSKMFIGTGHATDDVGTSIPGYDTRDAVKFEN